MNAEPKPLTGRKVLLIAVAAFGVIIAANLTMLLAATGTFPGLVVANSYVASQGWDRKANAQRALGWTAAADYSVGTLRVAMTGRDGAPLVGLNVVAVVGRPASDSADIRLELAEGADDYAAPLVLLPGRWRVLITGADVEGNRFEAAAELTVRNSG
ncbi:MAG TPA: FixH family protein [Thermohalobaculum sp.]|nr:FixH family protein [Thermohalobaculum sp.]